MNVLIRVQHRIGRDEPLLRLLGGLPPAVEVITDRAEELNPWRGYKLCFENLPESGHVLIIQDDTIVCRNFGLVLERIAAANPDTVVALFCSKAPKRTHNAALLRYGKSRYVATHLQDLVHVVALLWPVSKARDFMQWCEDNSRRITGKRFQSDDATVSRWMQFTKQTIRVTVPSIVEHPDDVPSVVNVHKMANGEDSGRCAGIWIGDQDPLELDWKR